MLKWERTGDVWTLKDQAWPFTPRATVRKLAKQLEHRWYAHVGSSWNKFANRSDAIAWATVMARMQ